MVSTLSTQLQQLREHGAGSKRSAASFLYDPREAARIDDETIYNLAWNGWLELKQHDARLDASEASREAAATLLSRQRIHFHRVQLTPQEDRELNATLRPLLDALSRYFLLPATHKVVEFLVRRYEIHRYNVDDVMAMIVSYHESTWFAKMVKILHIRDTRWEFLLQVKQSGENGDTPLLRSALVQRAIDESSVIEFIFSAATRIGTSNPKLISFYALIVIQMIEQSTVNEPMLRWLLPELLQALKIKHFPEAHAAAYMIVTTLASKAVLSKPVVDALVTHLVKYARKAGSGTAPMNALLCVTYVAQTQPAFHMTSRIAKHVIAMENLVDMLNDVASTYETLPFLRELTAYLVDHLHQSEQAELLVDMIPRVAVLEHLVGDLVDKLLRICEESSFDLEDDGVIAASTVLTAVTKQFVEKADEQVQAALSRSASEPTTKEQFDRFLNHTFGQIANSAHFLPAAPDQATSLALALESPNESTRFQALQTLEKQHNSAQAQGSSVHVLTSAGVLFRRMHDESARIVKMVATSSLSDLLFDLASKNKLFDNLVQAIQYWSDRADTSVVDSLMHLLVDTFRNRFTTDLDDSIMVVALSLLLPRDAKNSPQASERVWMSITKLSNPLACALPEPEKTPKDLDELLERLGSALIAGHLKQLSSCLRWCEPSPVNAQPMTSLLIPMLRHARTILREKPSRTKIHKEQCKTLDTAARIVLCKEFDRVCTLASNPAQVERALQLAGMMSEVACEAYSSSVQEFDACVVPMLQAPVRVFVKIQSVLAELFEARSELEGQLLPTMGRILIHAISHDAGSDSDVRQLLAKVRALDIVSVVLTNDLDENEEMKTLLIVVAALCDASKQVREASLNCLQSWIDSMESVEAAESENVVLPFVHYLLQARSDILMDSKSAAMLCGAFSSQESDHAKSFGEQAMAVIVRSSESDLEFVAHLLEVLTEVHAAEQWDHADDFFVQVLSWLSPSDSVTSTATKQHILKLFLAHYLSDVSDFVTKAKEGVVARVLNAVLECRKDRQALVADVQAFVLMHLSDKCYSALDTASQYSIVNKLLDLLHNGDEAVVSKLSQCWQVLPLPPSMFVRLVSDEIAVIGATDATRTSKKNRASDDHDADSGLFQRLTSILEVLTIKVGDLGDTLLLKTLGDVLELLCRQDYASRVSEYVWQVLFECLRSVCQCFSASGKKMEPAMLSNIEPESLVRQTLSCMERTISPQTRNQALLFVGALVHLAPSSVLQSLDRILSFLSHGAMHREDDYSFTVLETIIQAVAPHILDTKDNSDRLISCQQFVRIFVSAFDDIPAQRRQALFEVLVRVLGREYLPYVVVALLESRPEVSAQAETRIQFAHQLCFAFDAVAQVTALVTMLRFARDLNAYVVDESETDTDDMDDDEDDDGFELADKFEWDKRVSEQQLFGRSLNLALVQFIPTHLQARELHLEILRQQQEEDDDLDDEEITSQTQLQEQYLVLAQLVLLYFQRVTREQASMERNASSSDDGFWSNLSQHVLDILSSLQQLLSTPGFVALISELLHHDNSLVRKKAMQLFNERLQDERNQLSPGEELLFVDMIEELDRVLRNPDTSETSINIQTALLGVDILARRFADQHTKRFERVVPTIIKYVELDLSKTGSSALSPMALHLLGCAFVSLSSICRAIGPLVLPYVPKFFPNMLNAIAFCCENAHKKSTSNGSTASSSGGIQTVLQCLLASLQVFTDRIPQFLTPYLSKIVQVLLSASTLTIAASSSAAMFVDACFVNLTNHVELRHLLPPLFSSYEAALTMGGSGVERLFSVLSTIVAALQTADLRQYLPLFARFFVTSLDLRRVHSKKLADMDAVEDTALEVFVQFILRLSEKQMKPLFLQLCEWPRRLPKPQDKLARETTFCKLLVQLSARLKSIFVPYYAHVLEMLATVVQDCCKALTQQANMATANGHRSDEEDDFFAHDAAEVSPPSRKKRRLQHATTNGTLEHAAAVSIDQHFQLLQLTVSALNGCFEHDTEGFMDKDKFDLIMTPLVDIVDVLQTKLPAQAFVCETLADCVANLAWAAKSDLLWKPLHYAVLMKSRGDHAAIRLATLKILDKCYSVIGDEFLAMLPESIPFLAELMEDNDAEVERTCHQVIKHIEEISGESLDQYLTA